LYVKDKGNLEKTEQLKTLIQESSPRTEAVIIRQWEEGAGIRTDNIINEIKGIIKCINGIQRRNGEKPVKEEDIFGIIEKKPEGITEAALNYELKIPLVLMNGHENLKGIYSLAQALELALRTIDQETRFSGWIRILDPIVPLTDDMYEKYVIYREQILIKA
ncbi:MAG: hypothetical protein PHW46_05145, partial [Candidatus Omnitrophica bacterium]|nr:hypothetical protein [Candidatus Omnitrophota bacterium]